MAEPPNNKSQSGLKLSPSRLEILLTLLWFGVALLYSSNVQMGTLSVMVVVYLGGVLCGIWMIRLALRLIRRVFRGKANTSSFREGLKWTITPLCVLLLLVISRTEAAFKFRLMLSEQALQTYLRDAGSGIDQGLIEPARRIGLFWISEIEDVGGPVRMVTCRISAIDGGLVYSPDSPPPSSRMDSYRHLYGPWWIWVRSF
ncbi:MAG: hypothetical protein F6K07_32945 [Okeania sp. SIO1H5]|uniref:hypothetical protein n=1 Tax=Okeania sp. SIO1H5 TaxID=2607777 RepID=UPI0013BD02CC|nr:hypothetical protein [Okeania sp. SIO1H5]NET23802.1 hypothetical protein [Okeania sp. SIO1H5]